MLTLLAYIFKGYAIVWLASACYIVAAWHWCKPKDNDK